MLLIGCGVKFDIISIYPDRFNKFYEIFIHTTIALCKFTT